MKMVRMCAILTILHPQCATEMNKALSLMLYPHCMSMELKLNSELKLILS